MSAGPVTFKVVINHVECEGLDPTPENGPEDDRDVEPTTNPYVTFSWPGRPQFKTKHLKGTLNPFYEDWEEQFYYSTRFPDQLRVKKILVSVFSWSRWKSHRKIGHCEVNLATIACGPLAHRRTLTAGNGDPAGIISFEIEMMEVVRSMKLELLNLSLPSWIPNPTPGAQVCIDYFLSARPEETFRTRSLPASRPPAWPKSKALRTKVQVGELLDYNFEFLVNFVVRGKCVPFLKSSCSFLDLVEKKRPSKHISLPLVLVSDTKKQAGTIVFDAKVTNGPRFCQITDPHSSHSDKGVIHNGPVSKYFPLPPRGIIKKATDKNPFLFPVTPVAPHRGIGEEEKAKSLQDNCQPSNTWIIEPRPKRATPEDELIPLPRFWSLRVEQSTGYVRFMYRPTKKDTYQDPRGLPGGWSQCLSSRGELYWYQSSTGGTTKTDPRGMPPDWHLVMQKEGKGFAETFVYQHMTSCLHDPRGLPEAFSQHLTPTGKVYYMDHQRRDTTFQDPRTLMPKQMLSALVYNDILKYMSAYWANAESLIAVEKKRKQQEYETMVAEKEMEAKHEAKINSLDQRLLDWVEGEARKWVQIANAKDEDYRSKEKQWMVEKHELEDKLTKEIQDWEKEFLQKDLIEEEKKKKLAKANEALDALAKVQVQKKGDMEKERVKWVDDFLKDKQDAMEKQLEITEAEKNKLDAEHAREYAEKFGSTSIEGDEKDVGVVDVKESEPVAVGVAVAPAAETVGVVTGPGVGPVPVSVDAPEVVVVDAIAHRDGGDADAGVVIAEGVVVGAVVHPEQ